MRLKEIENTISQLIQLSKHVEEAPLPKQLNIQLGKLDEMLKFIQFIRVNLDMMKQGFEVDNPDREEKKDLGEFASLFKFYNATLKNVVAFHRDHYDEQIKKCSTTVEKKQKTATFWEVAEVAINFSMKVNDQQKVADEQIKKFKSQNDKPKINREERLYLNHLRDKVIDGRITEFQAKLGIDKSINIDEQQLNYYERVLYDIGKEYEVFTQLQQRILKDFPGIQSFTKQKKDRTERSLPKRFSNYFIQIIELVNKTQPKIKAVEEEKQQKLKKSEGISTAFNETMQGNNYHFKRKFNCSQEIESQSVYEKQKRDVQLLSKQNQKKDQTKQHVQKSNYVLDRICSFIYPQP